MNAITGSFAMASLHEEELKMHNGHDTSHSHDAIDH